MRHGIDKPTKIERMFLALWPTEDVRARLAAIRASIKVEGGRLIDERNLHITLVFLGAVDAERRACIERICATIAGQSFALSLQRVQAKRRSGIVWLAPMAVPPALAELARHANLALADCGHVPDPRPYSPHVTLWRDVRQAEQREIAPINWSVNEFCLVTSRPTSTGSEYIVQRRWPLRG